MTQTEDLINVSAIEILITMVPLMMVALVSSIMGLGIASPILVGTIRAFVQLSILGFILDPIFMWGVDLWWLVLGYCGLMILLASYESSVRSKYYLDGQFGMVLLPMAATIVCVGAFAFCIVLKPDPVWDPQYVIPIVGMLLGNCINGVSLALNSILTSLVESSREIELLLSFGANSYEATSRLFRDAVRTGAMPQLNGMAIIGIISIPGMMTGQILGGTSVMQAARYQILITYFIALCSFGTTIMETYLTLQVCFDSRTILRTDLLRKRDAKPTFLALLRSLCKKIGSYCQRKKRLSSRCGLPSDESTRLLPSGSLCVSTRGRSGSAPILSVEKLSYGFETQSDDEAPGVTAKIDSDTANFRTLFENVSFQLYPGSTTLVSGPSGVGKSSLLRIVAGLTKADADKVVLSGVSQINYTNMPLYRKKCRYVPQTKVDIPGTPYDFMAKITSFKSWKSDICGTSPTHSEIINASRELLRSWGMNSSLLDSEWKSLSGGESQRILVAISLASLPHGGVILLDESTSALDLESKLKVESSVQDYCTKKSIAAVWISHDTGQQDRMKHK
ncbi:UPF0014 domain containing protein [Nitzschia inconspicua]|uniref:UPF0014 domain containing protein n=1 Tax=Nitzschia inconspicua TaxID=303405 RepID=A0A9K3LVT6_9STRA|nr:UPF0014 domain containing protein [Nitzschia inconspicua]